MLGQLGASLGKRLLLLIVSLMLCVAPLGGALGQIPTFPSNPPGGGISYPPGGGGISLPPGGGLQLICQPDSNTCLTKEAREKYAKEHNCKFKDEICRGGKLAPSEDSVGAKSKDQRFWGSLWDGIKSAVTYGYEFVRGLFAGLKEQVSDLWHMVTNPGEIVSGLVELGKAFYNDPKGTMAALGQMIGQEAIDTFTRATQCGAYDLGEVIGSYVSPAFALKLATKLTKFSGKLGDAAKALRRDYGCASFVAGTLILTADGAVPVESITVGQQVRSRNESSFADRSQSVTDVFGRIAPSYRRLATETELFKLTDEHPLWLQGKGWTEAGDIVPGDIIASEQGDTMVIANDAVKEPVRVYNFSVQHTPSYFAGARQIWVHNAGCSIDLYTKAWSKLAKHERGFRGELEVFAELTAKGYTPVGNSFDPFGMTPEQAFKAWNGQTGIDAIYKDRNGNYVIIESKATGGTKKADPDGCVEKLCLMKDRTRQMSDKWIRDRLADMIPDPVERKKVEDALTNKTAKRVYAQTDQNGTSYHEITEAKTNEVKVSNKKWNP